MVFYLLLIRYFNELENIPYFPKKIKKNKKSFFTTLQSKPFKKVKI